MRRLEFQFPVPRHNLSDLITSLQDSTDGLSKITQLSFDVMNTLKRGKFSTRFAHGKLVALLTYSTSCNRTEKESVFEPRVSLVKDSSWIKLASSHHFTRLDISKNTEHSFARLWLAAAPLRLWKGLDGRMEKNHGRKMLPGQNDIRSIITEEVGKLLLKPSNCFIYVFTDTSTLFVQWEYWFYKKLKYFI